MSVYTRWKKKLAARKRRLKEARAAERAAEQAVAQAKTDVDYARRVVERHRPSDKPKIVRLDLDVANVFGPLGAIRFVTGHYTAGPRDTDDAHALALWRQYHEQHKRQGWGGIGYHYGITKAGTIVLLRSTALKGAHTGGANTGNVGVVCHGTTGDRPTSEQAASFKWLLANAHTSAMPTSHRAKLAGAVLRGHKDWMATACPGGFYLMYRTAGETV